MTKLLFFPVCETVTHQRDVEEDVVDCQQESVDICRQRGGHDCPTVPKTSCKVTKQNVTKDYTDTQVNCLGLYLNNHLRFLGVLNLFPTASHQVNNNI